MTTAPDTLLITCPPGPYEAERRYVFDVMLRHFLGLDYQLQHGPGNTVRICLAGDPAAQTLELADGLFQTPESAWLKEASLPTRPLGKLPLAHWLPGQAPLPVLYGAAAPAGQAFPVDLFGGAFFMLSRYEELVSAERDPHERFPASAALAVQEGLIERPLVNEYLEVLWALLRSRWPALSRRPRARRIVLTHDVDWPYSAGARSGKAAMLAAVADLVRRREPALAVRRLAARLTSAPGRLEADPNNTFDFIMEQSERHGLASAFYFIAGRTAGMMDGCYELEEPWIQRLLRRIAARGHELGLHPSYHTFRDAHQTGREFRRLRRAAEQLGVRQARWGGRQHYLRWENPTTWKNWEAAGLSYDSTLTFAEAAGFRCGCCYAYPVYDLRARAPLALWEQPLVAMDVTLFQYMGLSEAEALSTLERLNAACRRYDGDFTLLWHNSNLVTRAQQRFYRSSLEALCA